MNNNKTISWLVDKYGETNHGTAAEQTKINIKIGRLYFINGSK